ncbi:MAG: serine hydrolase domain-containing protein [Caulobacterales bacterium]
MHAHLDRRALTQGLAALLCSAGAPATAGELEPVLNPPGAAPMASAGIIARHGDGRVALRLAAGLAFGPAGARPFALDQPFRIASVSKMFATAAFLPLAMRKGLDLEGDASPLVGFRLRHPAWPDTVITPRMLLSHTSGLRNGKTYPVPLGRKLEEAFAPGGRHYDDGAWFGPAEHRPGDWFAYADVNFALVAQLLERASGERFDLHMRRVLFAPLGLDVGYNWSGVSAARRARAAAAVHWEAGQWATQVDATVPAYPKIAFTRPPEAPGLEAADYRVGENGFVFSPQGGLRLSVGDMDRLARLFAAHGRRQGRRIVPRAALEAMQTRAWTFDPAMPNGETDNGFLQGYGLGCEAPLGRPGPQGDSFFGSETADWRGHFGDAYGWITGLFWNRRDGRTLVYALNGMPEQNRPPAKGSAFTAPEEALVAMAARAWRVRA